MLPICDDADVKDDDNDVCPKRPANCSEKKIRRSYLNVCCLLVLALAIPAKATEADGKSNKQAVVPPRSPASLELTANGSDRSGRVLPQSVLHGGLTSNNLQFSGGSGAGSGGDGYGGGSYQPPYMLGGMQQQQQQQQQLQQRQQLPQRSMYHGRGGGGGGAGEFGVPQIPHYDPSSMLMGPGGGAGGGGIGGDGGGAGDMFGGGGGMGGGMGGGGMGGMGGNGMPQVPQPDGGMPGASGIPGGGGDGLGGGGGGGLGGGGSDIMMPPAGLLDRLRSSMQGGQQGGGGGNGPQQQQQQQQMPMMPPMGGMGGGPGGGGGGGNGPQQQQMPMMPPMGGMGGMGGGPGGGGGGGGMPQMPSPDGGMPGASGIPGGGGGDGLGGGGGGLGDGGSDIMMPPAGLLDRLRSSLQQGGGGGGNGFGPPGGGGGGPMCGGPMGSGPMGGGPMGGSPMGGPPGGGPSPFGGPPDGRTNLDPSLMGMGGMQQQGPRPRGMNADCDYNPEQGPRNCRRSKLSPFLCLASEKYPNATAKYMAKMYESVLKQHAYPDLDVADIYDGDRPAANKQQSTICDSEVLILRPGFAINTDGQWRAIFQDEKEFAQRLRVETCRHPKQPCKHIPGCHATQCTQKYAYIRLLSFDPCNRDAGPSYSMYRVPTACECRLMDEKKTVGDGEEYGPNFSQGASKHISATVKEMAKDGSSGGDAKPAFA